MTAEEIESRKSDRGGWTRASLAELGVPWPPPKGWKRRLLKPEPPAHSVCANCKLNPTYMNSDWCEPCVWKHVQDQEK